jgi:hypothetical protein
MPPGIQACQQKNQARFEIRAPLDPPTKGGSDGRFAFLLLRETLHKFCDLGLAA